MKTNQINDDTPVMILTVGQLTETLAKSLAAKTVEKIQIPEKRYVYGYKGIANLFGCSIAKAAAIKLSGKIDPAIRQIGKNIIVDADLALELASAKTGGRKK